MIEKILEMAKTKPMGKIAEELSLSFTTVRCCLRKHRVKTKSPHERSREQCLAIMAFHRSHGFEKTIEYYGMTEDTLRSFLRRQRLKEQKHAAGVSTDTLRGLRFAAMRYAQANGMGEEAEDFASYCVLQRMLQNGVILEYALINYRIQLYGDFQTEKGNARRLAESSALSINHTGETETVEKHERNPYWNPVAKESAKLDGILEALSISKIDRVHYLLHHYMGLSTDEIGFIVGEWDAEVLLHIKRVQEKINRFIAEDKERLDNALHGRGRYQRRRSSISRPKKWTALQDD